MKATGKCFLTTVLMALGLFSSSQKGQYVYSRLQEVCFNEVKIRDAFWLKKIKLLQQRGLPLLLDIAEAQGKIDNFRIVAGKKKGKIKLYNAADSDVFKLIEDACYSFVSSPNKSLESRIDSIVDIICDAQAPDGYLDTQYMLSFGDSASPSPDDKKVKTFGYGPEVQWRSLYSEWPFGYSQLYCAGHLMEAAYAHYYATGSEKLLKVALKLADNVVRNFNEEKIKNYGDHPEVEIGLMKLWELTGNKEYLRVADLFSRYIKFTRPVDIGDGANALPLARQTEAFGHCVRTAYIYCGATDVVRATGSSDLRSADEKLWLNVTGAKMYIHGGTGNGTLAEQHGEDFDLPIYNTYSESCAAIAQAQWNERLNLLYGDAKYADFVEAEMYNNALASISQDCDKFFYSNKLNIDTNDRKNEHSGVRRSYLFCCPSKVPGLITGIGRWAYAKDNSGLYINQLIGTEVKTVVGGKAVAFTTSTSYPWKGSYRLRIDENELTGLDIYVRLPAAVFGRQHLPESSYYFSTTVEPRLRITVNGKSAILSELKGYVHIESRWIKGDVLDIEFELPVRRIYTKETVRANSGRVALMYGPMLFSLEGIDNDFDVLRFRLPNDAAVSAIPYMIRGEKILALRGEGISSGNKVQFTAIPYFMWQNRGIYKMSTLLIEDERKVRPEKLSAEKMNTNG